MKGVVLDVGVDHCAVLVVVVDLIDGDHLHSIWDEVRDEVGQFVEGVFGGGSKGVFHHELDDGEVSL